MKFPSLACVLWLSISCLAGDVAQKILFTPDRMPASGAFDGMPNEAVNFPAQDGRKVLKVTYPKWEKGAGEWPSIYFRTPNFSGVSLEGWDGFAFTVFNPSPFPVDMGVCLDGDKRWTKHYWLPAQTWTHRLITYAEIREKIGAQLLQFDFFMTRPEQEFTLYYTDVKLVKRNPSPDTRIPSRLTLADFEDTALPAAFETCGATASLDASWARDGRQSVRIKFPAYVQGMVPNSAFQFWTTGDVKIGSDWSAFSSLSCAVKYTGTTVLPLKVQLTDANGKPAVQECLLNPGEESVLNIPLRKLDIDLNCVEHVEFMLERPLHASEFLMDSLQLNALTLNDLQPMAETLANLRAQINDIQEERRGNLLKEYAQLSNKLNQAKGIAQSLENSLQQWRQVVVLEHELQDWKDNHSRLLDEENIIAKTASAFPRAPFGIAIADSMTKVMINDLPLKDVSFATEMELELAKNEYESCQLVLVGKTEATAAVEVGELRGDGMALPVGTVTVSLVGHVKCDKPPYDSPYQGWWPDPLLDFQQTAQVKPREAVSFWLRVKTPENAKAGIYTGQVVVKANGQQVAALPLRVRVFDFIVPDKSPLDTAMDFRDYVRPLYGKDMPAARHEQLLTEMADKMAEYKMDFDRIYRSAPKAAPASLALPIDILKRQRDKGQLRCFNITSISTPRDCTSLDDPRIQQEIDRVLTLLDYWTPILEREGLLQNAYLYGYDEYPASTFPVIAKVFKAIKAKYPKIPIATTAYDHTFGMGTCLGDAVDIFTPLTPRFLPDKVAASRAAGHRVWWYICIGPKHPYANWFVEYPAIEARLLMGAMTAKYRPDGFLYYAVTRWPVNDKPIDGGPYTNWNPASFNTANGDGSIFCAGPHGLLGTIRVENFRDGLEDFAYVLELEKRLGGPLPADLQVPGELVENLMVFSRNPKVLRAYRRRLAAAIEALPAK